MLPTVHSIENLFWCVLSAALFCGHWDKNEEGSFSHGLLVRLIVPGMKFLLWSGSESSVVFKAWRPLLHHGHVLPGLYCIACSVQSCVRLLWMFSPLVPCIAPLDTWKLATKEEAPWSVPAWLFHVPWLECAVSSALWSYHQVLLDIQEQWQLLSRTHLTINFREGIPHLALGFLFGNLWFLGRTYSCYVNSN